MTKQSKLIEQVLELLKKIGVKADFHSAKEEDEAPMIRTNGCYILFTPESVLIEWQAEFEVSYGEHTAKEILSGFTPDVDGLFDGESQ